MNSNTETTFDLKDTQVIKIATAIVAGGQKDDLFKILDGNNNEIATLYICSDFMSSYCRDILNICEIPQNIEHITRAFLYLADMYNGFAIAPDSEYLANICKEIGIKSNDTGIIDFCYGAQLNFGIYEIYCK